jgi:hypothetical protein
MTNWESREKRTTNQKLTQPRTNDPISGTTLSSTISCWSRQQKAATIAAFAILGLLLAVSACSKQAAKPALVGVSSPAPTSAAPATASVPASEVDAAATLPIKKTARKRPANVTYSDSNSGVSFLYPRKFALATGEKARPELAAIGDVPMNFVQAGGSAVATVTLPDSLYPGTDFEAAFFNVNVNHKVSEEECQHFAFVDSSNADGEAIDAGKVKVGPTEMEMTSDFSANIMKQAETQYYHDYENGACYEYVLGLGTAGFATEGGLEHVNRDAVFAKLEKILATVKIASKIAPVEPEPVAEQTITGMGSGKE